MKRPRQASAVTHQITCIPITFARTADFCVRVIRIVRPARTGLSAPRIKRVCQPHYKTFTNALPRPDIRRGRRLFNVCMKSFRRFMCVWLLAGAGFSNLPAAERTKTIPESTGVIIDEVTYQASVADNEARFQAEITAESTSKQEIAATLFEGEVAILPPKLPKPLRLTRQGNEYRLFISKPGRYQFKLDLVAKVKHAEPWNLVSFKGPVAAIASVTARASGADVDLQLLSGTLLASGQTNGQAQLKGFLGPEQTVALRWSRAGGTAEVARRAVVTAETTVNAQITPTVVKYVTQIHFDIIQGKLPNLALALPASHALTKLGGEQVRDWEIKPGKDCATFPTVAIVYSPNNIGFDNPTEPYTWCHAVALKRNVFVITEDLPRVQKWRNFKVRCHPRDLCPHQMNTLFDTQRDKMLIDETVDAVSA